VNELRSIPPMSSRRPEVVKQESAGVRSVLANPIGTDLSPVPMHRFSDGGGSLEKAVRSPYNESTRRAAEKARELIPQPAQKTRRKPFGVSFDDVLADAANHVRHDGEGWRGNRKSLQSYIENSKKPTPSVRRRLERPEYDPVADYDPDFEAWAAEQEADDLTDEEAELELAELTGLTVDQLDEWSRQVRPASRFLRRLSSSQHRRSVTTGRTTVTSPRTSTAWTARTTKSRPCRILSGRCCSSSGATSEPPVRQRGAGSRGAGVVVAS
jgi:hypothetical protein